MAEPGSRRPGVLASLRPTIAVPRQARGTFAGAVPCFVATWALGGLYLLLGPSLAATATGSPNLLWGGLVIFLICGIGATAAFVLRGISSRAAMLAGCLFLLAGVAVTFGAIAGGVVGEVVQPDRVVVGEPAGRIAASGGCHAVPPS